MKLFFRYFFRTLRFFLEPLILIWDSLSTPKGIERPESEQQKINLETQQFALYQYHTCPFCIKVRRAMKRLSLNIEILDAQGNQQHRQELMDQGGKTQVPCLKITQQDGSTTWMYESNQIISFLQEKYAA